MRANRFFYLITFFMIAMLCGCESLDNSIGEDPYGGGKENLGIKLLGDDPVPSSGVPGDTILFKAQGLLGWCDPTAGTYQFQMFMGGEEAKILTATDSTLTVEVPQELSSGITYIVIQNQVFYGPTFTVRGNVSMDEDYGLYKNQKLLNGTIYDVVESPIKGKTNNFYLVGQFIYSLSGIITNGIAMVDEQGNMLTSTTSDFQAQGGFYRSSLTMTSSNSVNSLSLFEDGKMLVSGTFDGWSYPSMPSSGIKLVGDRYLPVSNMALLDKTGVADTMQLFFSETMSRDGTNTATPVARFNGGVGQSVLRSFVTKAPTADEQKVIAVGNFTQYITTNYSNTYAENIEQSTAIGSVVRLNRDGSLDTGYRGSGSVKYTGAEGGTVTDAYMDEDNGVVLVGTFTSFDGVPTHGIVRLTPQGDVDEDYLSNVGMGFNGRVSMIRYNSNVGKAAVVGAFTTVDGHASPYIAVIGKDGKVDKGFATRGFSGGMPTFAGIVSRQAEKLIVGGTFNSYDGIHRYGFLVLDMDGRANQDFNIPGQFIGDIQQVKEAETSIGDYGLLLVGNISMFNGKNVNDVVMLQADFK